MTLAILEKLTYGLYIVASKIGNRYNGQIINTAVQVTAQPPQVAVVVNKKNFTWECIRASRVFTISILSQSTPMEFISLFGFRSGRDIDKFERIKFRLTPRETPVVIENTVGYLECEVVQEFDVGTHSIFIGKVIDAETISDDQPMTYSSYHNVKHGLTHQNAPTFHPREDRQDTGVGKRYKCTICGYIYDPAVGDPEQHIKPGTAFEDLPDDWVCPICGATKDKFVPLS